VGASVVGHGLEADEPLSPVHAVHAPPLHTGVVPEHWVLVRQPVHVLVVMLQNGVAPPQFTSPRQATHPPLTGLHSGVAAGH
jgi:hypothetical protein